MRGLLTARWFWAAIVFVVGALAAAAWYRSEFEFLVVYLLLEIFAVARTAGWRPGSHS